MGGVVGADHDFHDPAYASGWAARFAPTGERLVLFDLILSHLREAVPPRGRIVELGIGPGYLADHLLRGLPGVRYHGVDSSEAMLALAAERLGPYGPRVGWVRADLVEDRWWEGIPRPIEAVVSTWALHDLGSRERTGRVYGHCVRALKEGGVLLNGDFVKPDRAPQPFEPGRFEVAGHLELLRHAGFRAAECLAMMEQELESPSSAQNYACLKAVA